MSHSSFSLQERRFADLPNWGNDDPRAIFSAFCDIEHHLSLGKAYKSGSLGLECSELETLVQSAKTADLSSASSARIFFEQATVPFQIVPKSSPSGFVTGFYEPTIEVGASPSDIYRFPIYRRPVDLVEVKTLDPQSDWDQSYAFARRRDDSIDIYPNRQEIESGYLNGQGLEIAWAKSKVEVFFVHIQGAARLVFPDGTIERITYDGKSGHLFTPIGKLLIERGEIIPSAVSMQAIRDWLLTHPEEADEVMWHNRSFIFFKEAQVASEDQGPIAAAKIPLIAGRALALDKAIHTFGFPFFISAPELRHLDGGKHFGRLMLALDTGSAIIGPARGDIFTGSGYEAGEQAGTIKHPADFYILIPKDAAQRYRA